MKQPKRNPERGLNIVMVTGILTILMLFAAFGVNVARYYSYRNQLRILASEIASYAGTFLPNPKLATQAGFRAFQVLKQNLRDESGASRYPAGLVMEVSLDFVAYNDGTMARKKVGVSGTLTYNPYGPGPNPKIPIRSLNIKLSAPFDLSLLNFTAETDISIINVSATVSTELVPTDVVLVIENSNSVISPLEDGLEAGGNTMNAITAAFGNWDTVLPGRSGDYGSLFTNPPKSLMRARQCFGQVTKDIKTAALRMFDILTASTSNRVGVIHTLNFSGEYPSATIKITPESYINVHREKTDGGGNTNPGFNDTFDFPEVNQAYGSYEMPESRCLAVTSATAFQVPGHALGSIGVTLAPYATQQSLNNRLVGGGMHANGDGITSHLTWDDSGGCTPDMLSCSMYWKTLHARDLIWTMNAGVTNGAGVPIPKYDYVPMQFAIQRAFDMLRDAPARTDKLPVKRKLVLVFTDGFEKPFSTKSGYNMGFQDTTFTRVPEVIQDGSSAFTKQGHWVSYSADGTPTYAGVKENYCIADAAQNPIIPTLSEPSDEPGVKLGILYYSRRGPLEGVTTEPLDPLVTMRDLIGHSTDDSTEFRNACSTPWTSQRGRFFYQIPPGAGVLPKVYYDQIVPRVAGSILVSEITE